MRLRYLRKYSAQLRICESSTGHIDWRLFGTEKVSLGRRVGSKAREHRESACTPQRVITPYDPTHIVAATVGPSPTNT